MKKSIAIVEDEPAIRDNYAAAFTREGYQVQAYGSRRTAMAAFQTHLPDLVVIDISLQDEPEGGFELCRELRGLSAKLPIIFQTARDSEPDAVSGLRRGALSLDAERIQANWNGEVVLQSLTEFWIVHALARHRGHVKNRQHPKHEG